MNTKKRKVKNEAEKPPSKRAKVEENKQEKENTALKTEIEVKYFVGKEEIKKNSTTNRWKAQTSKNCNEKKNF